MPRSKARSNKLPKLDMTPMIDCVFQLIIFFILTIKMDQNLDDILKLPPAYKAVHQEEDQMQIYVLPAAILPNGEINPDSTGLIAFTPRDPHPTDPRALEERFVPLDSVGARLVRERKRVTALKVQSLNAENLRKKKSPLSAEEEKKIADDMPLMIKADNNTFYGRILQVVNKARAVGIRNFAIVTTYESSEEYLGAGKAAAP